MPSPQRKAGDAREVTANALTPLQTGCRFRSTLAERNRHGNLESMGHIHADAWISPNAARRRGTVVLGS